VKNYGLALLVCVVVMAAGRLGAQMGAAPPPQLYSLRYMNVADTKPQERVWFLMQIMDGQEYRAVECYRTLKSPALRRRVSTLPPKTIITLSGSSQEIIRPLKTPPAVTARPDDMSEFAGFCRSKDIDFQHLPTF
jgi:hypothetical protein